MTGKPRPYAIEYLGWSGFHLHGPGLPSIFIDPPKGTQFPDSGDIIILLTHGHPEHLGGTIDFLNRSRGRGNVTLVASVWLCRYFGRHYPGADLTLRPATNGEQISLSGNITLSVFGWTHMPLLPPGLAAAACHLWRLIRKAPTAWHIARMMMQGPKWAGPMLGYKIEYKGTAVAVAYGEGLHRRCEPEAVAWHCAGARQASLLAAVEPEDEDMMPRLLRYAGIGHVVLYAPHKGWRTAFGLPQADLPRLKAALEFFGLSAEIAGNTEDSTRENVTELL
ncbi:hypothetical protein ACFO5Q_03005 [Kordiimonas lipolytica]|uniref:Metallo-beta-lactamase domain-containing protein n=1 Tax=Kordiimonas lipolytica TaxID=1662421 RepID=A0ABV8U8K7_9PROT|nr:hypothetical protein [Kordiimonas lipolytica]